MEIFSEVKRLIKITFILNYAMKMAYSIIAYRKLKRIASLEFHSDVHLKGQYC